MLHKSVREPKKPSTACDACKGTGKKVYDPDPRGIVNVGPCPKCDGKKRI